MGLSFLDNAIGKKRDQIMAVDLGARTTKAVRLQRRGQGFALCGFALLDAPIYEKTLPPDFRAEHPKAASQALQPANKYVSLTAGVNDALLRHADIPRMPVNDMRQVLKLNAKNYLQQDLPGYVFDCHISPLPREAKTNGKPKDLGAPQKHRVLVTGARKQFVQDFAQGAKNAGLVADCVVPSLIGPVNVFEKAMPELFAKEAVALVDVGFRNSS